MSNNELAESRSIRDPNLSTFLSTHLRPIEWFKTVAAMMSSEETAGQ